MLAFLGTNDYLPCNYLLNGKKVENVRFIQEAIAGLLCKNWNEEDRIIIFLTEEAKNKNWVDNGQKDRDGKSLQRKGLKHRLESLKLKANIYVQDVPNGQSEDEIWDIFDAVLNQINDSDEVIFDITHGFRSLPMLMITILNYARVLRDIKIRGAYYGAFESLGTLHEVEKMGKDRNAPIFDLTPFIHLFDWATAIDNFLIYGDAKEINVLTKEEITPILRETKGKDKDAQNLKDLGVQLERLTELIQTSRARNIIDFDFEGLKDIISHNKGSRLNPLNPLLDRMLEKIKDFENNDIENGYAAVKWCIEHNLIQQGYTILQETMISEIVAKYYGENEIIDKDKRGIVSQAINIKRGNFREGEWNEPAKNHRDEVQKIINDLDDELIKIYDSISQYRNDINHAGFINPHKPENLKRKLKENYKKLKGDVKNV